jgi:hypothetical protein
MIYSFVDSKLDSDEKDLYGRKSQFISSVAKWSLSFAQVYITSLNNIRNLFREDKA